MHKRIHMEIQQKRYEICVFRLNKCFTNFVKERMCQLDSGSYLQKNRAAFQKKPELRGRNSCKTSQQHNSALMTAGITLFGVLSQYFLAYEYSSTSS